MNYRLKRWLRYIFFLVFTLILCWQDYESSVKINEFVQKIINEIIIFFDINVRSANYLIIIRKIGHGVIFFVLAFLGHLAISGDTEDGKTLVIWSSIMNIGFALLAELTQAYAAGRHPVYGDALINFIGSVTGILIAMLVELLFHKSAKHLKNPP